MGPDPTVKSHVAIGFLRKFGTEPPQEEGPYCHDLGVTMD